MNAFPDEMEAFTREMEAFTREMEPLPEAEKPSLRPQCSCAGSPPSGSFFGFRISARRSV